MQIRAYIFYIFWCYKSFHKTYNIFPCRAFFRNIRQKHFVQILFIFIRKSMLSKLIIHPFQYFTERIYIRLIWKTFFYFRVFLRSGKTSCKYLQVFFLTKRFSNIRQSEINQMEFAFFVHNYICWR